MIVHQNGNYTWEGIDVLPYKEDGTHFKSITRQTLFHGDQDFPVEFRYFEIAEGGHSTLERHEHQHAVMIIRGSGHVFVKDAVAPIALHDIVHVPTKTWHQFRADSGEPLGFLCIVTIERDRPERPDAEAASALRAMDHVGDFIRL